jgi:hypothetical protein
MRMAQGAIPGGTGTVPSVGWQRATEGQRCASEDAGGGGNVALHLVEGTGTATAVPCATAATIWQDTGTWH